MPGSNAQASKRANHATNATNGRNVRVQDSGEIPSVPDPGKPVDKGIHICPASHAHGANATCYGSNTHRCRCDECKEAQRLRIEKRRKQIAYGRHQPGRIDSRPAGRHVNRLRALGWTVTEIAKAAGVGPHAVSDASLHPERKILPETAAKILAISVIRPQPSHNVDSTGTIRRLQALVFMGWTVKELCRRIGTNESYGSRLMSHPYVYARTRQLVAEMYDELWDKEPPQTTNMERFQVRRSKAMARRRGWVGPLSWDDIDTDPEPATAEAEGDVDELAVELAISGQRPPLTPAERHVVVTRLHGLRWSDKKIATHIGVSSKTVERDRKVLHLAAWDQNDLEDERAA